MLTYRLPIEQEDGRERIVFCDGRSGKIERSVLVDDLRSGRAVFVLPPEATAAFAGTKMGYSVAMSLLTSCINAIAHA